MKKKLMMVTLLLAGLTMGACVDDKESASVTAVRDAKTEQLESVAAMNSAAAEAKQAMAAAEAALKLAEAEAKQAAAELLKAEAEYEKKQAELMELQKEEQTIENQQKQAWLEQELARLEVEKKKSEQRLAQIKAEMEKAQIEAQKNLVAAELAMKKAEQALLNYEKELADAKTQAEKDRIEQERIELQNLALAYRMAVEELNTQKARLIEMKADVVRAEGTLATTKDLKEQSIAANNNEIAKLQVEIEALKKYTNYTEDIETLKKQYDALYIAFEESSDIYMAAYKAYFDYTTDLSASDALQAEVSKDILYNYMNWQLVDENGEPYAYSDGSAPYVQYWIRRVLPNYNTACPPVEYIHEESGISNFFGDSLYVEFGEMPDLRQFELDCESNLKFRENTLEGAKEQTTMYQTAYDGEATLGSYPYYVQATNVDGTPKFDDEGNPVYSTDKCTNLVDSTLNAKAKYDQAAAGADKAAAKAEYEEALRKEKECKEYLDDALTYESDCQITLDCLKKQIDIIRNFDTYNAALQGKIKARNEQQVKDYAELVALWMDSEAKALIYRNALTEFFAVDIIYNDYYENGAATIAASIATKEARIAELKAKNADISEIETMEEFIALAKELIAAQEEWIKVYEVLAEQAKADLDAAMAKNAAAE